MALRPWRAFLLAPLAAPIAYWIDLLVEAAADPARRPFLTHGGVDALAISILIGGPIAYAATAIVGIPLWLGRRELFSIPLGAWRGGALGLITSRDLVVSAATRGPRRFDRTTVTSFLPFL